MRAFAGSFRFDTRQSSFRDPIYRRFRWNGKEEPEMARVTLVTGATRGGRARPLKAEALRRRHHL